ncbi:MAG: thiamine pyrophosphate-requiring protein [Gammaproteobacteria bacterium]|nr:thiamine pyrophosphate-requiring protein [Gammaproteobacteria bacterium]
MNKETKLVRSTAAALLDSMWARGVRHVFANAGTDFAPIIEAMVEAEEQGRDIPRFHAIPHENVAIAMAHGYYLIRGEPAAVMVHVTVGTANALCGIMNASRDNVPVLLLAGRTPNTETGHAGSRSAGIHWGQDSFDQGGIVREYVKWDYELRSGQPVDQVFGRAVDIAMSEPRGPVYLCMPREVLGDAATAGSGRVPGRMPGSIPAEPSPAAIGTVARWLAEAEFPLILTATAGRDPANFECLSRLAEDYGVAVAYPGEPGPREVSIPSDHRMFLGLNAREALERADLVLTIDCEVPWWPRYASPRDGAKLVHVAADPLYGRYPMRGFGSDMAIAGSSSAALRALSAMLAERAGANRARIETRRKTIAALAVERRRKIQAAQDKAGREEGMQVPWIAACINRVKGPDTIVVNELGVPMDMLDLSRPKTYLSSSSAGGLGFGLGASLGAKLAAPDRRVMLIVGDGSYLFGNPVSAHLVARAEGLASLTVVLNNGRWHAVKRSTLGMYPDGRAAAAKAMPLVELGPSPDYEKVIAACGGHGERVEKPGDLEAALRRALAAVDKGTPALLNVITQPLDY